MADPDPDRDRVVLAGYGEIGTKSAPVRRRLTGRLRANLAAVLADRSIPGTVERRWSRLVVHTPAPGAGAAAAGDVAGLVWARPATVVPAERTAVVATAVAAADRAGPGRFAVRARRTGPPERHPFGARELERAAGAAIERATGAAVDLDAPETTVRIEVRGDEAFVSTAETEGPGGLPVGTGGRVVALVSGGIDSPVAAWALMRRGAVPVPVYVDLGDYGGADHRARAEATVAALARRAPDEDLGLRVVEAGDLVAELVESVGPTRTLSLRRAMLAAAAGVAEAVGADALVTGEALGQKSSQTGPNLAVTDAAVDLPVHRPLLARDKAEIVATARALGSFDDATVPAGCERVAPAHPETAADRAAVERAEPDDLLARARALGTAAAESAATAADDRPGRRRRDAPARD